MSQNLRIHEGIKYSKDLTALQIWNTLNGLLYEAAAPFAAYGNYSVETAISCLILSTNNRRVPAMDKSTVFLKKMFVELVAISQDDTEDNRIDLLKMLFSSGVERNIFTDHINLSMQCQPLPLLIDRLKLRKHVFKYLEDYSTFKRDVVFRYYYMIQRASNKNHYVKSLHGLNSTKNDTFHVYIISMMRALDRFIPHKSPLTSYMMQWFKNAEGSSDYMVYDGEAFTINRSTRKAIHDGKLQINNSAIPIDDRENSLADIDRTDNSEYINEFLRLCARLPNSTIVFLAQAFPYKLSAEQKKRLAS